jgi:TolB protein
MHGSAQPPHRIPLTRRVLLLVALLALFSTGLVASAHGATLQDRIAFASDRTGNYEIFSMAADGSDVRQLTHSSASDVDPTWSPDGTHIAFASDRGGNYDIYVMASDGSDVEQLTTAARSDRYPAYAPDGTTIAFRSTRFGEREILLMNADGSDQRRIAHGVVADQPAWSPDGKRLAYVGVANGTSTQEDNVEDIFTMAVDGGDRRKLTATPDSDRYPSWSPDGKTIAFRRQLAAEAGGREVFLIRPDGTDERRLTVGRGPDRCPAFSPDSRKIVYVSAESGDEDIYVRAASGAGSPTRLTAQAGHDIEPHWAKVPVAAPSADTGSSTDQATPSAKPTRPTISLAVRQRLLRNHVVQVLVGCGSACALRTSASLTIAGIRGKMKLRRVTVSLRKAGSARLRLRLSRRTLAAIRAAIASRSRTKIGITARVVDIRTDSGASARRNVWLTHRR